MKPKTAYVSKLTLHRRDDLMAYAASAHPRGVPPDQVIFCPEGLVYRPFSDTLLEANGRKTAVATSHPHSALGPVTRGGANVSTALD